MTSVAEAGLRVLGLLVALAAAIVTAVWETFLTPLYIGGVRAPVAVVLAGLTQWWLVWFSYRATMHKALALVPGLVWMGVVIFASGRTAEGDVVLAANNWVALLTILAGVTAYAIAGARLILPQPRPLLGPPAAGPPPHTPAGSAPAGGPAPPPLEHQ